MARRDAQEAQNAPTVHGTRSTTRSTTTTPHPALTSRSVTAFRSRSVSLRTVTDGRARERAGSDARRPFRTHADGSFGSAILRGLLAFRRWRAREWLFRRSDRRHSQPPRPLRGAPSPPARLPGPPAPRVWVAHPELWL